MAAVEDRDPYEVLGVDEGATQGEIEQAWRRALRATHPDCNPGDPAADRRVREVLQAGELLRDPARRARYDRSRRPPDRDERPPTPRQPTWTTLAWDGGKPAPGERFVVPGGVVVIHRKG